MEVSPEITIENKNFKVERCEQNRNKFDAKLQLKYSSDKTLLKSRSSLCRKRSYWVSFVLRFATFVTIVDVRTGTRKEEVASVRGLRSYKEVT